MAILDTNEMMFTAFEPKLQNRFIMYIDGIPAFLVRKVGRPNISFGDATISSKHRNFFVNKKNANFEDMLRLINFVKDCVKNKFKIQLELELVLIK